MLSGSALAGTISQTLTFGAKAMCESGNLPLQLYAFQDGAFTGTINVTTPVEGKYRFDVSNRAVGDVPGIYLVRYIPGLILMIR